MALLGIGGTGRCGICGIGRDGADGCNGSYGGGSVGGAGALCSVAEPGGNGGGYAGGKDNRSFLRPSDENVLDIWSQGRDLENVSEDRVLLKRGFFLIESVLLMVEFSTEALLNSFPGAALTDREGSGTGEQIVLLEHLSEDTPGIGSEGGGGGGGTGRGGSVLNAVDPVRMDSSDSLQLRSERALIIVSLVDDSSELSCSSCSP